MFLTHANLTVAALKLLPSWAIVFFLKKTDNIYFYGVACNSEHLPRKRESTHFFLPHLKSWTLHFWLSRRVPCPSVKMAVRQCCPSCWDTEPWANGNGKGEYQNRDLILVCRLSLFLKARAKSKQRSTIKWTLEQGYVQMSKTSELASANSNRNSYC